MQRWLARLEGSIELLSKSQEEVRSIFVESDGRVEAKFDANIEAIWNVISDLCSRIAKFEAMESVVLLENH